MDANERLSRRRLMALAAIAPVGLAQAEGKETACCKAVDFVLVHGGWRGGWCWRRVARRLAALGHRVHTPTLTGLGERSHLLGPGVGLETHVQDVLNVMHWERLRRVVLCGHSNAGPVISMLAERTDAIRSIVFLDAFVPDHGQSVATLASPGIRAAIQAAIDRGDLALPPPPAEFFQVDERNRALVDALCTPHPVRTFAEPVALTGARERIARKTFIRSTGFPSEAFDAAQAKLRHLAGWRIRELGCGHDAMLDAPAELTELLLQSV